MRRRIGLPLILCIVGLNLLVWQTAYVSYSHVGKIPEDTSILGHPFGGLSYAQAAMQLERSNEILEAEPLTLTVNDKTFTTSLQELGYQINTEAIMQGIEDHYRSLRFFDVLVTNITHRPHQASVHVTVDQEKTDQTLGRLMYEIAKEPENMSLDYVNGQIIETPAQDGITLDQTALQLTIQEALVKGQTQTIALPYTLTQATIREAAQVQNVKDELTTLLSTPTTFTIDNTTVTIPADTLFSFTLFNIEGSSLSMTYDETKIRSYLESEAKKIAPNRLLDSQKGTTQLLTYLSNKKAGETVALTTQAKNVATTEPTGEYQLNRFEGKYIEVDISQQQLYLIEGGTLMHTFAVSSGKRSSPTPLGEFKIYNHIPLAWSRRAQLYMRNWMAIVPGGLYGIHQLPHWPDGRVEGRDHIGKPVSGGCVRLAEGDAEFVYNWTPNSTPVIIHQ